MALRYAVKKITLNDKEILSEPWVESFIWTPLFRVCRMFNPGVASLVTMHNRLTAAVPNLIFLATHQNIIYKLTKAQYVHVL